MANPPLLPSSLQQFEHDDAEVRRAFAAAGETCLGRGGHFDEKTRRLVKPGLAVACRNEGAAHSAARHALSSGDLMPEVAHVANLAVTNMGRPFASDALTWIQDAVSKE